MEKLIDISSYPVANVLDLLLQDKSTKKNIIWATDTYENLGEGFDDKVQLNADSLLRRPDLIRPRIQKSQEAQAQRTRKKQRCLLRRGFAIGWNNYCDVTGLDSSGVFNTETQSIPGQSRKERLNSPKIKSGSTMWIPGGWKSPAARLHI